MIVKCIDRFGKNLPSDCLTPELRFNESQKDSEFSLTIGKFYVVYAVALYDKYMWYALCENNTEFPIFEPSPFFSIEDNQISKYWNYSFTIQQYSFLPNTLLTFPEWVDGECFYSNLLEGEEEKIKIFAKN